MWEKEKISRSFSTGIIILIFLLLFVQFAFFIFKAVDTYKSAEVVEKEAIVSRDTIPTIMQKEEDILVQGKGSGKKIGASVDGKKEWSDRKKVPYSSNTNKVGRSRRDSSNANRSSKSKKDTLQWEEYLQGKIKYHNYPIELNKADTSDFNSLYGIGSYFAKKIVEYRERLGGSFVVPEQLMEVWGIDSARFSTFSDRLFIDSTTIIHIDLYTLEIDSLAKHPYIGSYAAKGIERYRRMVDRESFTVDKLVEYNIIAPDKGAILKLYHK